MSTSSLIDKLQELSKQNQIEIFVPSIGTYLSFKQLSVKQQKDLIKTGLEGVLAGIHLENALNKIIVENSTATHEFLTIDKVSIAANLRLSSFGVNYSFDNGDKQDISDLSTRRIEFEQDFTQELDLQSTLKVKVSVPTLFRDTDVNNAQLSILKGDKDLNISDAVGTLYIYEVVKYIKSVTVGDETLDFYNISISDAVKVVERLPVTINNQIVQFIQSFKVKETEFLTIGENVVAIDARFFTTE